MKMKSNNDLSAVFVTSEYRIASIDNLTCLCCTDFVNSIDVILEMSPI